MIELKSARYIKRHSTQPISITDATRPTVNTNLIIYVTTQCQRQLELLKVIWWCNISLSYYCQNDYDYSYFCLLQDIFFTIHWHYSVWAPDPYFCHLLFI